MEQGFPLVSSGQPAIYAQNIVLSYTLCTVLSHWAYRFTQSVAIHRLSEMSRYGVLWSLIRFHDLASLVISKARAYWLKITG